MTEVTTPEAAPSLRTPDAAVLTAGELQSAAARGSMWTLLNTGVGIPIAFAANAVVARSLGAADYGRLAVITLVMGIAVKLTNFGVGEAVQQWGAAAHARGDAPSVDEVLRKSLGFHLLIQLPLLVAVALVMGHGEPGWVQLALLAIAVMPPLLGGSSLCMSIENRTATSARMGIVVSVVTQTTLATVAVVTHSPVGVWASRSLVPVLMQPVNLLLITPHRRRVTLQPHLPRQMPTGFWRFSLLTCAADLLGLLVTSRSEILVLQWLGDARMVGVFALAFGIATQLRGPVESLMAPLLPGVAGIVEAHPELAGPTLRRALVVSALFAAGILLGLPLLVVLMPFVYGADFTVSAALLPALAVAALAQAMINPLAAFARAQLASGRILASNAVALTVDMLVACALIPWLGLVGAVVAALAAQAVNTMLMASIQVRKQTISWRGLGLTSVPLLLAVPAMAVSSAAWLRGDLGLGLASLLLAVAAWIIGMRRLLPADHLHELNRAAAGLPGPLRTVFGAGVRLLENRS